MLDGRGSKIDIAPYEHGQCFRFVHNGVVTPSTGRSR